MRKVTLLVCLLSWASLAAGESAGKPIIKVDQAEYDYGLIWSGPSQQHSFKITNTGTAELKIDKVRPNCGCTVAGNYPKSLAPGASGTFPFSLNTTAIKGPFTKDITIATNDPATPSCDGRWSHPLEPRLHSLRGQRALEPVRSLMQLLLE